MTNENALNILEHYQISIYSISKFADKVYELRLIRNENSVGANYTAETFLILC